MNAMWIITAVSLIGVWLNIKKKSVCFLIWIFTNGFWAVYDYRIGAKAQAALFAVYFGLAVYGLLEWRREKKQQQPEWTGKKLSDAGAALGRYRLGGFIAGEDLRAGQLVKLGANNKVYRARHWIA